MTTHLSHKRPTSQGFTIVEVLVALLVLAIGLLGLAGLQTVSLRASQESHYRSFASVAAQSLGELIVLRGEYRIADGVALRNDLEAMLPGADLSVETVDSGTADVQRFGIEVSWDGRQGERATLRYIVAAPEG